MHNPTPASDEWRKTPGKKDTNAWCRGKVGREHTTEIRLAYWYGRYSKCGYVRDLYPWWESASFYRKNGGGDRYICGHERYCSTCGKVFGKINPQNCPDRVEDEK